MKTQSSPAQIRDANEIRKVWQKIKILDLTNKYGHCDLITASSQSYKKIRTEVFANTHQILSVRSRNF